MYLTRPHSLQAPACTYSSSNRVRTLTTPCPGPDSSTSQSAPLVNTEQLISKRKTTKDALPILEMVALLSVAILHDVKDIKDVSLVLQCWTLFQLPHQPYEVCFALWVSRQVQISSTVGLVSRTKTLQTNSEVTRETKLWRTATPTLCCLACGTSWGWGTSSRLRDLRCLFMTGVTGRYMEDSA